jgi:2-oxoglutarate dehydrogenase E2 component (dihydrolipoamide succinyltransferase)
MSVDLKIPAMGESVTEIYIGKWYKSEGEVVEQDEQIVELESEKATLDLCWQRSSRARAIRPASAK